MNKKLMSKYLSELSENEFSAVLWILQHLQVSKNKHPKFAHQSLTYAASIVAEEAGELAQAVNQYCYENGESYIMADEAADVGAVAIRALSMVMEVTDPNYKSKPEDSTKAMIETIISWEKNLGEYGTLENKLRTLYEIKSRP